MSHKIGPTSRAWISGREMNDCIIRNGPVFRHFDRHAGLAKLVRRQGGDSRSRGCISSSPLHEFPKFLGRHSTRKVRFHYGGNIVAGVQAKILRGCQVIVQPLRLPRCPCPPNH